jgi:23S rRNA (guanine745-N1)-methyltransferase
MPQFICPVCGGTLQREGKTMQCGTGHSYDLSKYGYVNLLRSTKSSAKRHGDDKMMVRARRDFLDRGYYNILRDELTDTVLKYSKGRRLDILDAGCGECWYTAAVAEVLAKKRISVHIAGVDISKDALIVGAKRRCGAALAVASVYHLPVGGETCDLVLNLFAPYVPSEFARVLRHGGWMIRAIPLERHLMGLKERVYDTPYLNTLPDLDAVGFTLLERRDIQDVITVTPAADVWNLFKMTPYYYKTGVRDQAKLADVDVLKTEIGFGLLVYRKD